MGMSRTRLAANGGDPGKKNGEMIPFRYGGSRCDFDTRIGRSNHPLGAGSKLVTTVLFSGVFDRGKSVSQTLAQRCDAAMSRCTSKVIV